MAQSDRAVVERSHVEERLRRATTAQTDGLERCACPRCGSTRSSVTLRSPDRQFESPTIFCVSRCARCGLLFQNPRIPLGLLPDHYPKQYAPYAPVELSLDAATRWHLKHRQGYHHLESGSWLSSVQRRSGRRSSGFNLIPDFRPSGRVIEIGCAAGNRLSLLKRLGWASCVGYEYSDSAAATARNRGLDIVTGPIEDSVDEIPKGSLDAIVAGFVMEHLTNPFEMTRRLASKLRPGGQFLFTTVNVHTPDFWLYKRYWYDLDLPRHMVFFRRGDLRAMLHPDFEIETILIESAVTDYQGSARYRKKDRLGGWRELFDDKLLRGGALLRRALALLARTGLGARIYVIAKKR
jgi:SAM-dependent methyltransferase